MSDLGITFLLIGALFLILASGVWIGLTLTGFMFQTPDKAQNKDKGDAEAA